MVVRWLELEFGIHCCSCCCMEHTSTKSCKAGRAGKDCNPKAVRDWKKQWKSCFNYSNCLNSRNADWRWSRWNTSWTSRIIQAAMKVVSSVCATENSRSTIMAAVRERRVRSSIITTWLIWWWGINWWLSWWAARAWAWAAWEPRHAKKKNNESKNNHTKVFPYHGLQIGWHGQFPAGGAVGTSCGTVGACVIGGGKVGGGVGGNVGAKVGLDNIQLKIERVEKQLQTYGWVGLHGGHGFWHGLQGLKIDK